MGMGLGAGASLWTVRFVRSTMQRYSPEQVSTNVAGALARLGSNLSEAAAVGRAGMRQRESELRSGLAPPR